MNDFGIEYVGKQHAQHLQKVLEDRYTLTMDWEGRKFAGIDLDWNYASNQTKRTCQLSMHGCIDKLLIKYNHTIPTKPQLSPHCHREIVYEAKEQLTQEEDTSPTLDAAGIKCVQAIVGALLYYARVLDKKLLVALSTIRGQQAAATEKTNEAINQLLDYCATYPKDGIVYRSRDMIICAHSDAGFHNESHGRSRSGAHLFLAEDEPIPKWDGPVLTIAQIMEFVMASA